MNYGYFRSISYIKYGHGNFYDKFYVHEYLCLKEIMKSRAWNFKIIEKLLMKFVVQVLQVTNL